MVARGRPRKKRTPKSVVSDPGADVGVGPVEEVQSATLTPTPSMPNPTEQIASPSPTGSSMTVRDRKIKRIRRDYCDLKDGKYQYMLVRDRPKNRHKFERDGYTIVKPEEVADHDGAVDQTDRVMRFGDRVAYKIPRDVIQQRRRERLSEHYSRVGKLHEAQEELDKYAGSGFYEAEEDSDRRSRPSSFNVPIEFQR